MKNSKKGISSLLAFFLVAALFIGACASDSKAQSAAAEFTPGTYKASAMGNNGTVSVSVTFSGNKIESINIDESKETQGLGTVAIDKLRGLVVDNQTLGVDLVTGATVSSGAFMAAVTDCVKQAGGDVGALSSVPVKIAPAVHKDLAADLLVVGGGSAGISAAVRASEAGLKVILLEKMPFTGGASMIAGGGMVVTGSKAQKDKGVADDSPESLIKDFQANGNNLNDMNLLTLYANNVGQAVDWAMEKMGVRFIDEPISFAPEYSHNRMLNLQGGSSAYGMTLRKALEAAGVTLMLETRADELIINGGAVTGVKATASNKSTYTITAKSVLMATGGFGNNAALLAGDLGSVLYYGPMSSTGDGQTMVKSVGAKLQLMEYGKMYPNGVEIAPRIGKSTIYGNYAAFDVSGILVNKGGVRVVNERASNKTVLTQQLAAEGKQLYLVMDATTYKAFSNDLARNGITQQDLERWIANKGSRPPVLVSGGTIEEAAQLAGINPAALKATVDRYNGFVRNGTDQDFGRTAAFMKAGIGAGPYYIIEQKPRFATTMGSVVTTGKLEVLAENNQVIPNLYAAGEMANGVHGDDSPSGANLGWALTSGKLAAEAIIAAQGR